jgi:hypothetical protein
MRLQLLQAQAQQRKQALCMPAGAVVHLTSPGCSERVFLAAGPTGILERYCEWLAQVLGLCCQAEHLLGRFHC